MTSIKPYNVSTQSSDSGSPKGSVNNPYSNAEYESMIEAGTWNGGYVDGMGYVLSDVTVLGSSNYDSDSWSDPWESVSNPWGSSDDGSGSSDNGNSSTGTGGNTGSGGNNNIVNNNSNSDNTNTGNGNYNIVDNAGEADYSSLYTFEEEEATILMDNGMWKGGYITGIGYVGPSVTIVPTNVVSVISGTQILQNALEYMGTPYKLGGCNIEGIDCSGLISAALNIPRWTTSSGDIPGMKRVTLTNINNNFCTELQKGDILVWRKDNKHNYGHAVIFVEETKIFHAHGKTGTPTGYTNDLITYWYKERGVPEVYRK